MQVMNFVAVNATTGAALPYATVTVYLTGTSTLASLYNAGGSPISNPTTASSIGAVTFAAANGVYDIVMQLGAYTAPTLTGVQLYDLSGLAPNSLASYAGVDRAGGSSSASAITSWLAYSLSTGAPLYVPYGKYLDAPREIDVGALYGSGLKFYGDGCQQSWFNIAGSGGWEMICSGGGGGAFYFNFYDLGFQNNANAPTFQWGQDNYADAFNGCAMNNCWFKNNATSGSDAIAIKLNEFYSGALINCTANAGGYSATNGMASLRMTQASFNLITGSYSGSDFGVDLAVNPSGTAVTTFTGAAAGATLTVSAIRTAPPSPASPISIGDYVQDAGGNFPAGTYVAAQGTGTGTTGTYTLANSYGASLSSLSIASESMYLYATGYSFGNVFSNLDLEVVNNAFAVRSVNAANNTILGGQYAVGPAGAGPGNDIVGYAGYSNIVINGNLGENPPGSSLTGITVKDARLGAASPALVSGATTWNNTGMDVDVIVYNGVVTGIDLYAAPGATPDAFTASVSAGFLNIPLPSGWGIAVTFSSGAGSVGWYWLSRT